MKNFSYKDIARLANVSISTVSRFYNGGYVSKSTKVKIQEIISKHNYYPNHGARLIRGNDNSVFIILPETAPNYYSSVILGINHQAKVINARALVIYASSNVEKYIETIKYVLSWKPWSVIFFLPNHNQEPILNYIVENVNKCASLVYPTNDKRVNHITIDYTKAFYNLTEKFAAFAEKNEKIAFVVDTKLSEVERQERYLGYEKYCREYGMAPLRIDVDNRSESATVNFINFIYQNNIVNLISSTHETFITLVSSKDKNLRLTDIGYSSIYDWKNNYRCKIFIDYHLLGCQMVRILSDSINNNMARINRKFEAVSIIKKKTLVNE
ncbi:LacI family DNA-binding transcriptional regulator [Mycoplasmopsis primatum]|uniref:LacI family DNA-binding transcriptional regulator n=1 Tax=Mycoplasmopsis primatum TaxID=55604 RepID=UPI0004951A06|nr:LacI family DNA-binding transcriptional regulator [Mycoplasmopsis primatum]